MTDQPFHLDDPDPSQSEPADDCERLRGLIAAYSVGATDADETRLVEALLPDCPEVAAELKDFVGLGEALLYAAPQRDAPPQLRARILQAAAGRPVQALAPLPTVKTESFWDRLRAVFAARPLLSPALAALAIVVLVASNAYWSNQVQTLRVRERQILQLVQQQNRVLASLSSEGTQRVELASTRPDTPAHATVVWNPESEIALLTTEDLPTLEPDRVYQLWLIRGASPIGAGTFEVTDEGSAVFLFDMDEPVTAFDALGVSNEPRGGSDEPTTDPILVGEV